MNISEFQDTTDETIFYDKLGCRFSREDMIVMIKFRVKECIKNKLTESVTKESIRELLEPYQTKISTRDYNKEVEDFMSKNNIK